MWILFRPSEGYCEGKRVIDNHKMATLSDTGKQMCGHVHLDLEDKLCYFEFTNQENKLCYFEFTNQCNLFLSEATILYMLRNDHIILKNQIG